MKIRITSDVDALEEIGIPLEEAEKLAGNVVRVENSDYPLIGTTLDRALRNGPDAWLGLGGLELGGWTLAPGYYEVLA